MEAIPFFVCFWTRNPTIIFHVPRCCLAEVNVQLVTMSSFHPVKVCLSKKSGPFAFGHFPINLRWLATFLSGACLPFSWRLFHNSYTTSHSIFTVATRGKLSLHCRMCLLTHFFRDTILLCHMETYLIVVSVWSGYVISFRRVQWLRTLSDSCICFLRIMFTYKRNWGSWLVGKLYVSDQGTYQL